MLVITDANEILGGVVSKHASDCSLSAAMERDGRPMRPLGVAAVAQQAGECVLPSVIDRTRHPGSL
jgi:hypothetical protein